MKPTFIALLALCLCLPVTGADKKKPGTVLWEFKTGWDVQSSPAIGSDGTVYVGSIDKKLYAINGKSGVKLWEFKTGDRVLSSPAIGSDGTVYVGSWDEKLYAINGKSGVKLWEFVTGGVVVSSPAIGPDGTVYVGSLDNKLYAIKTDSKGPAKSPWPMRGQNARNTGRVMSAGEGKPLIKTDFKALKALAEKGDARAQHNLGNEYAKGEGVLEDYVTAYAWLHIAAANGIADANKAKLSLRTNMTPDQIAKAKELSKEMVKKNPKLINNK